MHASTPTTRSPRSRSRRISTAGPLSPPHPRRSPTCPAAARSPPSSPQPAPQPALDLRSPDARDAALRRELPAGQPTWPVDPQPIAAPAPEPVTTDSGSPAPVVPIVAGALLVLLAALIARYSTHRVSRSTRVAA